MTKASVLTRLAILEDMVAPAPAQPFAYVEVHKLPESDRERYWSGDGSVFDAYADPDTQTIVVSLHSDCREDWLETRNLTEDALEAREAEIERKNAAERAAALRKVQPVVTESETKSTAIVG